MKLAIWILWPSFLVGAGATGIFFTVFDPHELHSFLDISSRSRIAAYSIGLFAFWAIAACSSALTCFLQRTAADVNRLSCPLPDDRRPPGCRA